MYLSAQNRTGLLTETKLKLHSVIVDGNLRTYLSALELTSSVEEAWLPVYSWIERPVYTYDVQAAPPLNMRMRSRYIGQRSLHVCILVMSSRRSRRRRERDYSSSPSPVRGRRRSRSRSSSRENSRSRRHSSSSDSHNKYTRAHTHTHTTHTYTHGTLWCTSFSK